MSEEPWFVTAFGSDYRRLYAHRDLDSARREVAGLMAFGLTGRVLDLACGFGRHSLALTEQGLRVVGIDLSMELLVGAPDEIRGRLLRGDIRHLPLVSARFDGVVNLFSSFGYFGQTGDREVLSEIARVLRPGGLAILDLMNPARVRAGLVLCSESEREGFRLEERRSLEEGGQRVVKEVRQTDPEGRVRTWREDVRLYEPAQIEALATDHGLEPLGLFGDFSGEGLGPDSARQILLARRLSL